ncbi:MAG: hypothetical protein K6L74_16800 [Neptuniibacter sp.]
MDRIQLSTNFYLDEFLVSETAARHGITISVEPGSEVFKNLERLCKKVLQPIRDHFGVSVTILSGYRPPKVNRLVGGSRRSAHMQGLAADIRVAGVSPYRVSVWVADNLESRRYNSRRMQLVNKRLPVDQCIHEFGQWVHLGMIAQPHPPRLQLLTAYKRKSRIPGRRPKTVYVQGIHRISDLIKD